MCDACLEVSVLSSSIAEEAHDANSVSCVTGCSRARTMTSESTSSPRPLAYRHRGRPHGGVATANSTVRVSRRTVTLTSPG